jgi:hypothetical protein
MRKKIMDLLHENEVFAEGFGHAEKTGVRGARSLDLTPTGTAASIPICPECAEFLKREGVAALTPLKVPK